MVQQCERFGADGLTCFTVRYLPNTPRTYCGFCRRQMPPEKTTVRQIGEIGPARMLPAFLRPGAEAEEMSLTDRIEMIRMQAKILERIGSKVTEQNVDLVKVVTSSALKDVAKALEQLVADRRQQ